MLISKATPMTVTNAVAAIFLSTSYLYEAYLRIFMRAELNRSISCGNWQSISMPCFMPRASWIDVYSTACIQQESSRSTWIESRFDPYLCNTSTEFLFLHSCPPFPLSVSSASSGFTPSSMCHRVFHTCLIDPTRDSFVARIDLFMAMAPTH